MSKNNELFLKMSGLIIAYYALKSKAMDGLFNFVCAWFTSENINRFVWSYVTSREETITSKLLIFEIIHPVTREWRQRSNDALRTKFLVFITGKLYFYDTFFKLPWNIQEITLVVFGGIVLQHGIGRLCFIQLNGQLVDQCPLLLHQLFVIVSIWIELVHLFVELCHNCLQYNVLVADLVTLPLPFVIPCFTFNQL